MSDSFFSSSLLSIRATRPTVQNAQIVAQPVTMAIVSAGVTTTAKKVISLHFITLFFFSKDAQIVVLYNIFKRLWVATLNMLMSADLHLLSLLFGEFFMSGIDPGIFLFLFLSFFLFSTFSFSVSFYCSLPNLTN